jgi:hypothetical protein
MRYTRQDYMNRKCSHSQYYAQFVTNEIKIHVLHCIGYEKIKKSRDEHFNDIRLNKWDLATVSMPRVDSKMRESGDFVTLAGQVCILKEAARQIKKKGIELFDD